MTTKFTWYLGADIPNSNQKVRREHVEQTAANLFNESGCTIKESTGTWKGEVEDNFLIEHVSEDMDEQEAEEVAQELKDRFGQESVMVEQSETNTTFV